MEAHITKLILAFFIPIVVSLLLAPKLIPYLKSLKVGQRIREDGPQSHFSKAGTPTMGGIMIILSTLLAAAILAGHSLVLWSILLVFVGFGLIGYWDDYLKVVLKRSLGLKAREKLVLQFILSAIFSLALLFYFDRGTKVLIPFFNYSWDLAFFYIPFLILVLIGTSNAVNLTDGLDGLASGVTFFVAAAYMTLTLVKQQYDLAIFSAALMGACLAFLFYNRHPAKIFMGDTGSLALGGAIAALAAHSQSEFFLLLIGGVYVIEALSVMIQVAFFKKTGKRVFLMSPIHHHYELKGWSENKIVVRFCLMTVFLSMIALYAYMITI